MLQKGDRVMALKRYHSLMMVGEVTERTMWGVFVRNHSADVCLWFESHELAHLPQPKEACQMCGSRDEHHSTTTCEEDRRAE